LLCAAIAGCGGSSKTLTQAQLVSKAHAACTTLFSTLNSVPAPPGDFKTNASAAAQYLDSIKPAVDTFRKTIDGLQPPSSLKAKWTSFASIVDNTGSLLDSADTKAHARDPSGIADYNKANANAPKLKATASAMGITGCP
jgi:Flp pilus assembly protein TadG